jgi:hypothetical protein
MAGQGSTEQLRRDIDAGRAGSKVDYPDRRLRRLVRMTRQQERRHHLPKLQLRDVRR